MTKENTGIIIQARTGSSRLPSKLILPFYEQYNVLEILLENLSKNTNIPVILATTINSNDDKIEEIGRRYKVAVFRGSENNVLSRFVEAAKKYDIKNIIRICSDNPFLDVQATLDLIPHFIENKLDYCSYALAGNLPSIKSHLGLWGEVTTLKTLEKVLQMTDEKLYLEHVTNFIYSNADKFNVGFVPAPEDFYKRTDIRLTLDTDQDFKMYQTIYQKLKNKDSFDIPAGRILHYIDGNQELLSQMKSIIDKNQK